MFEILEAHFKKCWHTVICNHARSLDVQMPPYVQAIFYPGRKQPKLLLMRRTSEDSKSVLPIL